MKPLTRYAYRPVLYLIRWWFLFGAVVGAILLFMDWLGFPVQGPTWDPVMLLMTSTLAGEVIKLRNRHGWEDDEPADPGFLIPTAWLDKVTDTGAIGLLGEWDASWLNPPSCSADAKRYCRTIDMLLVEAREAVFYGNITLSPQERDALALVRYEIDELGRYRTEPCPDQSALYAFLKQMQERIARGEV